MLLLGLKVGRYLHVSLYTGQRSRTIELKCETHDCVFMRNKFNCYTSICPKAITHPLVWSKWSRKKYLKNQRCTSTCTCTFPKLTICYGYERQVSILNMVTRGDSPMPVKHYLGWEIQKYKKCKKERGQNELAQSQLFSITLFRCFFYLLNLFLTFWCW